jgi:SAM-dependent methyltransferase
VATFRDHFSHGAAAYAEFRPRYPDALFAELAALLPGRSLGWDVGTGNGQAAVALARHVDRVIATDASAAQIAAAEPHPRVEYRVAPAESSGLPDASADVVTVAQALHWFDRDAFFAEAARVLRPGGVLAAWTYALLETGDAAIDREVRRFAHGTVGPHWPPERVLVDTGYATVVVPAPLTEVPFPPQAIDATLSLDQLAGFLRTWSATHRYVEAHGGADPVAPFVDALRERWGGPRPVRWPIAVRACRAPD